MTSPTTNVPFSPSANEQTEPVFFGAGLTHVGLVRESNEDSILTDPSGLLWAVADGMGGYGHGDVASDIVTQQLSQVEDDMSATPALRASLQAAHKTIQVRATEPGMGRMGATAVAVLLQNAVANIVWVGDCRAYLMRQSHLRLLTQDHTVVQELVNHGLLQNDQRDTHPEAHVVTRAVGYEPTLEIDAISVPVVTGDRIMLCSDGLTDCLGDHKIADHMAAGRDPKQLCESLIFAALEGGAPDNVSVVCVFALQANT